MISGTAKKRKCYPIHIIFEILAQPVRENLLSFTCMALLISQQSTMHGYNSLVRPRQAWRCCLLPLMLWSSIWHVPTTKQKFGCRQTRSTYMYICIITRQHISLGEGVRLPESCVDETTSYSRGLLGACGMWLQNKVQDGQMPLLQK